MFVCWWGKLIIKTIWFASVVFSYKTVAFNNYHSLNFSNKWLKCIFVAGLGINNGFPIQSDSNSFGSIIDIISYNLSLGTYGKMISANAENEGSVRYRLKRLLVSLKYSIEQTHKSHSFWETGYTDWTDVFDLLKSTDLEYNVFFQC